MAGQKRLGLMVQIKRYLRRYARFLWPSIAPPAKPIRSAEYFQEPCEMPRWLRAEPEAKAGLSPR